MDKNLFHFPPPLSSITICISTFEGVNFQVLVIISDNNLEISGAGSDGLGLAGFSPVISPASRPSAGKWKTQLASALERKQ